jgi:hypothetical protein
MNRLGKFSLLVLAIAVPAGCARNAPAMKRVVREQPIDQAYLRDVFIPSFKDPTLKPALSHAVSELDQHLTEFRDVMHQVESGRIPVKEGFKNDWRSVIDSKSTWIIASYYGRLGPISDFQKHTSSPNTLIYRLIFDENGYLIQADTLEDHFSFDKQGRAREFSRKRID